MQPHLVVPDDVAGAISLIAAAVPKYWSWRLPMAEQQHQGVWAEQSLFLLGFGISDRAIKGPYQRRASFVTLLYSGFISLQSNAGHVL